jgi:hypothetical protein
MRNDEAIAMNRFGLGATPGSALGANPHKALLDQFDSFDPRPRLIAAQPARAELVSALSEVREEKQQRKAAAQTDMAAEADKTPLPARRAVREDYVSAVHARLQTALASPTELCRAAGAFLGQSFRGVDRQDRHIGTGGQF